VCGDGKIENIALDAGRIGWCGDSALPEGEMAAF
jgi:hypothetical protein